MKSNVDLDVDRYVFEHGEGGWRRGVVWEFPKENSCTQQKLLKIKNHARGAMETKKIKQVLFAI